MASRTLLVAHRQFNQPSCLLLAPRLLRYQSTATTSLIPQSEGSREVSSQGRVRRKLRSMPADGEAVPPKIRGPPAIEDTWTMRLGDSTWYIVLGLMAGCTLWVFYEAQAGLRHRRAMGKKFFDQFEPDERAAQFMHPQSPFSEESLGTPNERFPFIIEEEPRKPGELPRTPSMFEKIVAADSVAGRKKLAAKRQQIAEEAQARIEAKRAEHNETS